MRDIKRLFEVAYLIIKDVIDFFTKKSDKKDTKAKDEK